MRPFLVLRLTFVYNDKKVDRWEMLCVQEKSEIDLAVEGKIVENIRRDGITLYEKIR